MAFRDGAQGVGYYRDQAPKPAASVVAAAAAPAGPRVLGAAPRPAMVPAALRIQRQAITKPRTVAAAPSVPAPAPAPAHAGVVAPVVPVPAPAAPKGDDYDDFLAEVGGL